ncbi:MAG: AAA family ATPase [Gemmatimonadaceae bacterium]
MEAHAPHRIVLIGPEASGKTTLARELAAAFDAPWTPEAARIFAESWPEPLSAATVAPIARLSMRFEDEAVAAMAEAEGAAVAADANVAVAAAATVRAPRLLVRDTDLVSTVVYARHYYGTVDDWIVTEARARRASLYLLCHPDLPWFPDGVRDRPLQRLALLEDFRAELLSMDARVADITGAGEERRLAAQGAIESFLDRAPRH